MKFSDLFLPKIARSDPKVRRKAVAAESNPTVLKKVVENDSDHGVRKAAEQRLQEIQAQG